MNISSIKITMSENTSKPKVKNYIVGPVNQYQRTINARNQKYPYFRKKDFSNINKFVLESLNKLLGVEENHITAMITGSGTLGMEIAALNFTLQEDSVIVISSGYFGERFFEILLRSGCNVEKIKIDFDKNLSKSDLDQVENPRRFKAVFVNHHETTTGHLHDLSLIRNFCDENDLLLIADCMTSFLSDSSKSEFSKCDVIITSSHKGMCCSPGLVFVTFKKSLLPEENSKRLLSIYSDLKIYQSNYLRNQTPYTPAIGVILELFDMFNLINSIGYDYWIKVVRDRAIIFRSALSKNWILPKHRLSNFMTPILLPENSDKTTEEIICDLDKNQDIDVTPISGIYKNRMLRISHVGDHSIEEIKDLAYYLNSLII